MLKLLKPLAMLTLTLCKNTPFSFDCRGHQELRNIAPKGLWKLYAVTWIGRMGWVIPLTTTKAPAVLINGRWVDKQTYWRKKNVAG